MECEAVLVRKTEKAKMLAVERKKGKTKLVLGVSKISKARQILVAGKTGKVEQVIPVKKKIGKANEMKKRPHSRGGVEDKKS